MVCTVHVLLRPSWHSRACRQLLQVALQYVTACCAAVAAKSDIFVDQANTNMYLRLVGAWTSNCPCALAGYEFKQGFGTLLPRQLRQQHSVLLPDQ
jgi:hypothetical protein